MAINYPGPYEVRLQYTTVVAGLQLEHLMRLNCNMDSDLGVGFPFASWLAIQKGGGQLSLQSCVDQLVIYLRPLFRTDSTFVGAELWKYIPNTFDAEFRASYAIALPGSEGIQATSAAGQAIITFRTVEGGIMRINLMESIFGAGAYDAAPFANSGISALATYLIGTAGWVLGRDTSYPNVALKFLPGQSEKLFKVRYRQ
jgi:hypothetical protein